MALSLFMWPKNKNIQWIVSAFDKGAGKPGAAKGPESLLRALNSVQISSKQVLYNTAIPEGNYSGTYAKHIESIIDINLHLEALVHNAITAGEFPIVLTGDHSNAIGAIHGFMKANKGLQVGVIWIDAHADLHSPYTTPSGNMHGMPLAVLLKQDNLKAQKNPVDVPTGKFWNQLKDHNSTLQAKNLVFIGLRDAEKEELALIDELKIKAFTPELIAKNGIETVLNDSLGHLSHCDVIYVSFDVDSMDPSLSTGTGTPVNNGLDFEQAQFVLKSLLNHPQVAALEITEINPEIEQNNQAMHEVVMHLLKPIL
jgi:arginase